MDRPHAVFFDMDDTLLDTSGRLEEAWSAALEGPASVLGTDTGLLREAIRREAREFWKDEAAVGHWRTDLVGARAHVVARALASMELEGGLAREIAHAYEDELLPRIALFPDALPTIEALRGAGMRLALLTNGPIDLQRSKVTRFDLARRFDLVIIEGEFGRGKPEPEVFAHAMERLEVAPGEAWMVGDNLYADIGGAKRAGLHAVWIHRDRLELTEGAAMPDRVIGNLGQLLDALELAPPAPGIP